MGRTIENPATGERVRWLVSSAESGGELVRAELWLAPGRPLPAAHVHRDGEERVELLAGRLELHVGPARRVLGRGDRATIPAGAPHAWRNAGGIELHAIVELRPAGDFEALTEALFALGRAGRLTRGGRTRPLDAARLHARFGEQLHAAAPPLALQRAAFRALGPVVRRLPAYPTVTARATAPPLASRDTST